MPQKPDDKFKEIAMSTLIFQINIKQWDKSQRCGQHLAERAAMTTQFAIKSIPEFFILDKPCIIDCHGLNKDRPLKKAMLSNGSVKLERFIISQREDQYILQYQAEQQEPLTIGNLNEGWIQAQYQWRYAIETNDEIYWQYEDLTLNAVCVEEYDENYFLNTTVHQEFCAPNP